MTDTNTKAASRAAKPTLLDRTVKRALAHLRPAPNEPPALVPSPKGDA